MVGARIDGGTDANALRVADLRAILHEYQIAVPSGARKAALVESFNTYVRPQLPAAAQHEPVRKAQRVSDSPVASPGRKERISRLHGTPIKERKEPIRATPEIKFGDENPFQSASPRVARPKEEDEARVPRTPSAPPEPAPTPPSVKSARDAPPGDVATPPARSERAQDPATPARSVRADTLTKTRTPEQVHALATQPPSPPPEPEVRPLGASLVHWRATLVRWLVWALALAWLYYCHRTRTLGFCDEHAQPVLAPSFAPQCTPCPDHAVCSDGAIRSCKSSDYVLEAPGVVRVPLVPYALPLSWTAPQCVPDTYKLVLAAELADAIVDYLAHWHGQVQCGRAAPHADAPSHALGRYAVPASSVRALLLERVDEAVDAPTFSSVWAMATAGLGEHASSEFVQLSAPSGVWFASQRSAMPVACRLRLYLAELVWESRLRVLVSLLAAVLVYSVLRRVQRTRVRRAEDKAYVHDVYARLQEQATRHLHGDGPREMPAAHLRDVVLATEPDPRVRRQRWAHVARIVEQNANVRTRQAQWHGEWQRVWEWVGIVPGAPPTPQRAPSPRRASPAPPSVPPR